MLPTTKSQPPTSGNGAGTPAVLNNFPKEQFNVLAPMSLEMISPYHALRTVQVEISPNPRDGMAYKVGSENVNGQWIDRLALSKVALLQLGDAAGVRWYPTECKRLDNMSNPLYVSYQVVGAIRRPDGSWFTIKATKELDLEVIREEIKAEQVKKGERDRLTPEAIETKVQAEWIQRRKHKVALCETGAYNRALRMLLKIKSTYTAAELQKPFIVTQVALNPASDPAVAHAMRVRVEKDLYDLGFEDQPPSTPALAEADARLALVEGTAEAEEPETVTIDAEATSDGEEPELPFDEMDRPEPTIAEEDADLQDQRAASERADLIAWLKTEYAPNKDKWAKLERWWGTHFPDAPETADLETLRAAHALLSKPK